MGTQKEGKGHFQGRPGQGRCPPPIPGVCEATFLSEHSWSRSGSWRLSPSLLRPWRRHSALLYPLLPCSLPRTPPPTVRGQFFPGCLQWDRVLVVSRWGSSTFAIPAWLVQAAPSPPNSHIPTLLPGPGPAGGAGWGSTGPLQLIQPFLRLALAKAGGRDGEGGPLLQSAHNHEEAGSQVTPQASSCRDGFEGCGVISPGWSRLSG